MRDPRDNKANERPEIGKTPAPQPEKGVDPRTPEKDRPGQGDEETEKRNQGDGHHDTPSEPT